VLGRIFDSWGWEATVTTIGVSLVIGCLVATCLHEPKSDPQ
jgi:hypothetical protein